MRLSRAVALLAASLYAASPGYLERISEDDLRANLSFLASDLLEGRSTPSPGQAIAAEFIASRFRLAHLQASNGGYCQPMEFEQLKSPGRGDVTVIIRGQKIKVAADDFSLHSSQAIHLDHVPLVRVKPGAAAPPDATGKALVIETSIDPEQRAKLMEAQPALLVIVSAGERTNYDAVSVAGINESSQPGAPRLSLWGEAAKSLLEDDSPSATLTVHVPEPAKARIRACNMAGLLTGSDPVLKQQYLIVSAHYDHLPMATSGNDRIFNGANDDASGTVSAIEIAQALASMPVKPRRSILFIAFTGEELGLLGSRYYARHPLVPLEQTVAQINLEQLGRINSKEGFNAGTMTFTGFDLTDLPHAFESNAAGVRVYSTSDTNSYFGRSDNQPLADAGVPASTVAVAYTFPEYHQVGDEWQKIDFANLVKIDQALAQGIVAIANRTEPPHWNSSDGRTKRYRQAYSRLHPGEASN